MELLGSVNKVDSKVILRISRTEEKTRRLGVFSRNGTNSYAILSYWRFDPGPRECQSFSETVTTEPKAGRNCGFCTLKIEDTSCILNNRHPFFFTLLRTWLSKS